MISWFEKHNKLSWLITIIIAAAIFYISSLTFEAATPGTNLKAIVYHISAFFFLAFFLQISLVKGKNKKFILLAILLTILYGISDELHQFFVPGRVTTIFDIFLNTVGVAFAFIIYLISLEYRKLKHYKNL